MKHFILSLATLALLLGAAIPAEASITLGESARGWIRGDGVDNGNSAGNNFIAGSNEEPNQFRDHFDFAIPVLSGTLTSATLSLDNINRGGPASTFDVSSLGTFGSYNFAGIGSGTLYGSTTISSLGTVTITLDAAALAAITAAQGGTFSLGGVDSGEADFPALHYDFGFSGGTASTLTLNTATSTPEPGSLTLLGLGLASFGGLGWMKKRRTKVVAA